MDLDDTHLSGLNATELFHTHYDQSASARVRIGYSPVDVPNVLLYATGGYATAHLSQANYIPLGPAADPFRSGWADGWVAGVGLEWAFASNLLAVWNICMKNMTASFSCHGGPTSVKLTETETVRARLSYKFNWATPGFARY